LFIRTPSNRFKTGQRQKVTKYFSTSPG